MPEIHKTIQEGIPIIAGFYHNIKKVLTKNDWKKIDSILCYYLEKIDISHTPFRDIEMALEKQFGTDTKLFVVNILINSSALIGKLGIKDKHQKSFLTNLHKKHYASFAVARTKFDAPERWRTVTTQLHQSVARGPYFKTRLHRYDGQSFLFESNSTDYFVLLEHLLKQLSSENIEPTKEFLEKIDEIVELINGVKKSSQARLKKKNGKK